MKRITIILSALCLWGMVGLSAQALSREAESKLADLRQTYRSSEFAYFARKSLCDLAGAGNRPALARLELAALQGDPDIMNELGFLYATGTGVRQDWERAFLWFAASAQAGAEDGMTNLAGRYLRGLGTSPDVPTAMRLFRRSARHGDSAAMVNLSTLYARGRKVPMDLAEAYKWILLAARDAASRKILEVDSRRDELQARMSARDLREGERRAAVWMSHPDQE